MGAWVHPKKCFNRPCFDFRVCESKCNKFSLYRVAIAGELPMINVFSAQSASASTSHLLMEAYPLPFFFPDNPRNPVHPRVLPSPSLTCLDWMEPFSQQTPRQQHMPCSKMSPHPWSLFYWGHAISSGHAASHWTSGMNRWGEQLGLFIIHSAADWQENWAGHPLK